MQCATACFSCTALHAACVLRLGELQGVLWLGQTPHLFGCSALLVKQLLLLALLALLAGSSAVSKVAHLLLLHALPPCTVQLQYLHQHFICFPADARLPGRRVLT